MKKIFFILMLIPGIGLSQSIGLKGGVVRADGGNNDGFITGLYGVTMHLNVTKKLQLGFEPGIIQKGQYVNQTNNSGQKIADAKYKISYFELPITFGFITGEKVVLGFNGGVSPKIILNASLDGNKNVFMVSHGVSADLIVGGLIGYKFSEKWAGILNGRYGHDLGSSGLNNYLSVFANIQYKL